MNAGNRTELMVEYCLVILLGNKTKVIFRCNKTVCQMRMYTFIASVSTLFPCWTLACHLHFVFSLCVIYTLLTWVAVVLTCVTSFLPVCKCISNIINVTATVFKCSIFYKLYNRYLTLKCIFLLLENIPGGERFSC